MRVRSVSCCLVWLAVACGGTSKPPPVEVPRVSLSPIAREIVGTGIDFTVEVTGCTKVARVWVTDGDTLLAELAEGGTTNTLSTPAKNIAYKRHGVPASLAIFAHATCAASGESRDSEEQPVLFMPAEEVVSGPVPFGKNFWTDSDQGTFLTCNTEMLRVDKAKQTLARFPLPFDCGYDAELAFAGDGNRYLMKPGVGVVGFTTGMQKTMQFTDFDVRQIAAPSTGVLAALGLNGILYHLRGYDPQTAAVAWVSEDSNSQPAGRIVFNRLGQVVFPGYKSATGSDFVDVGIEVYNAKTGKLQADRAFGKIKVDTLSVTPIPTITFDQTGEIAYFAEISDPSRVWACSAVDDATCTDMGRGLKWKSPQLPGGVYTVARTPSALVAYGQKVAYFLDPVTGATLTSVEAPIQPRGQLVFVGVVGGANGSTYLLAQGVDNLGRLTWGIKQILIFDAPNKLVSDFLTETDGFVVDLAPGGRAWLWRYDLTLLKLPADYRAAIGG